MIIKKLKLRSYRNYDNVELIFNDKLNIIIGDNGEGKTNILESIYVLAITKSYLNVNDKRLINFLSNYALIDSDIFIGGVNKRFRFMVNSLGKRVMVNDKEIKKLSDYISYLKVIIFSPDNIRIIKDGPSVRRKFLNVEISQIDNFYVKYLMNYKNLITQKNEYLKLNKIDSAYLDILNSKLVDNGIYLVNKRNEFILKINTYISNIFKEITGINGLKIKYLPNVKDKQEFFSKLENNYEKELNYKVSLVGPHRDDFIFILNDKDLSVYGSQGQIRCAVLSLKLAEVRLLCECGYERPVLLLDDIFSELDLDKRNNLVKYINDDVQTIITTTDINLIDENLVSKANVFMIKDNKINLLK